MTKKGGQLCPNTQRREKVVVDVLSSEKESHLEVSNEFGRIWQQCFLHPWLWLTNLKNKFD